MARSEYSLYDREEPNLSPFEMSLYESVSRENPWNLLEEFAELRRISPSDDERRAADRIQEELDEYGVPYDRYDPELFLSVPHGAALRTLSGEEEVFSGSDDDFESEKPEVKVLAFSPSQTVSGEVEYLDKGLAEDQSEAFEEMSLDESGADLEGKVVFVETVTVAKQFFRDVEEAGAEALVMAQPFDEPINTTITRIWGGSPAPDRNESVPDMPVITVSQQVGDRLLERIEADDPLRLEVDTDLTEGWFECPVIVARIPGEADPDTDEFVLLHGHLDSWFYGVTDNGTGNVGMVECARILNRHRDELNRDLVLGWWPGHEGGRYAGSAWYVDEFAHDLHENCVAHVNMDSPGAADATEFVGRVKWMASAHDLCADAIEDVCGKETELRRPARAGDYSFNNLGIPGMSVQSSLPSDLIEELGYVNVGGSGGHSTAWHRTTDTLEYADPDVLQRDLRVYLTVLARLLRADVVPLDFRRSVRDGIDTVREYDERGGDDFDLEPVIEQLRELEDAVESFYDATRSGELDAVRANEGVRLLSRGIVSVDFTSRGRFEQDPGMYRPPYPSLEPAAELPELDGDEYRFTRTHLKRNRNHVVAELKRIRRHLPSRE